jgi:hypothetical protein
METTTQTRLEKLIPSRDLIISTPSGLETVWDTNGHLRDQIRTLFREVVIECIDLDAVAMTERLRLKINEL